MEYLYKLIKNISLLLLIAILSVNIATANKCSLCGQSGHNKRTCSRGGFTTCSLCGEAGHDKRTCPKKTENKKTTKTTNKKESVKEVTTIPHFNFYKENAIKNNSDIKNIILDANDSCDAIIKISDIDEFTDKQNLSTKEIRLISNDSLYSMTIDASISISTPVPQETDLMYLNILFTSIGEIKREIISNGLIIIFADGNKSEYKFDISGANYGGIILNSQDNENNNKISINKILIKEIKKIRILNKYGANLDVELTEYQGKYLKKCLNCLDKFVNEKIKLEYKNNPVKAYRTKIAEEDIKENDLKCKKCNCYVEDSNYVSSTTENYYTKIKKDIKIIYNDSNLFQISAKKYKNIYINVGTYIEYIDISFHITNVITGESKNKKYQEDTNNRINIKFENGKKVNYNLSKYFRLILSLKREEGLKKIKDIIIDDNKIETISIYTATNELIANIKLNNLQREYLLKALQCMYLKE